MDIFLKDLTPKQIIEGVRDGSIKSKSFETNEVYMEWINKDVKTT